MSQSFKTDKKKADMKQPHKPFKIKKPSNKLLFAVATVTLFAVGSILLIVSIYQEELETDLNEEYHDSPVVKKYMWKTRNVPITILGWLCIFFGFVTAYFFIHTIIKAKPMRKANKKAGAK